MTRIGCGVEMNLPTIGERTTLTKGERQARAIVDAVRELVAEKPISEITIREITTRANITRPVFYFYFDTKYSPVAVAFAEFVEQTRVSVEEHMTQSFDRIEDALFRVVTLAAASNVDHFAVVRAALEARHLDPQLNAIVTELCSAMAERLTHLVDEITPRGTPLAVDDVAATVRALTAMTLVAAQNLDLVAPESATAALPMFVTIWRNTLWGPAITAN